jgi:hypothetical protein
MNSTTLSPVVCAPWCEDGNGHPDESMREDQTCSGPFRIVEHTSESDGTPQELGVYQCQEPGGPVHVRLVRNGAPGLALTLAEARQFRDELDSILSATGSPDSVATIKDLGRVAQALGVTASDLLAVANPAVLGR